MSAFSSSEFTPSEEAIKYGEYIYQRPYYRIAPFFVGMLTADIYLLMKDTAKRRNSPVLKVREKKSKFS